MQYRTLGRTGLRVSAIGLGTEYLIDRPREDVVSVIRKAVAEGVNYFDLFFAQPEFRNNMAAAFEGRREQVYMTCHLGSAQIDGQYESVRDPELSREFVEDFLTRFRTDYADVLFLHNSDSQEDYDTIMRPGGLKDVALELKRAGRARFIGFSGHNVETARQAVESGVIDVLMFPISIGGNAVPGKPELFTACARNNVGLVAMKAFCGGKLLADWTSAELNTWQLGGADRTVERTGMPTPIQVLHYALCQIGVSTVVPGCKNLDELAADLAYLDADEEERDFAETLSDIRQFDRGDCVYCNHCLPCPSRIDIGHTIRLLESGADGKTAAMESEYRELPSPASACIECGSCEERCPFEVRIIPRMREAAALYES